MTDSDIRPYILGIIDSFVPEHIIAQNPELIRFVRAYLEFLENSNRSGYFQNTLPLQRDIRYQEEAFLKEIEKELGLFVPREYAAEPRVFYHKIVELWRSKGTPEAIETFFQIFLNDPIQIKIPWEQVLIPSDGVWFSEKKLRVTMVSGDPYDFEGARIVQVDAPGGSGTSGQAESVVRRVEKKVYSDIIIYELALATDRTVGEFIPRANIIVEGNIFTKAEVYESVTGLNITNSGTGYKVGDRIYLEGHEGISFSAFVTEVGPNGEILSTRITDHGSGSTPNQVLEDENNDDKYFVNKFFVYEYADDPNDPPIIIQDYTPGTPSTYFAEDYVGIRPESNIISETGTGATFTIEYGSAVDSEGRYIGVKGQLDVDIVLQDSYYYQKYSYEVTTNYPINIWKDTIKRTVSPAGVKIFANVRVSNRLALANRASTKSFLIIPGGTYDLGENEALEENVAIFSQDYVAGGQNYFFSDYVANEYSHTNQITTPGLSKDRLSKELFTIELV